MIPVPYDWALKESTWQSEKSIKFETVRPNNHLIPSVSCECEVRSYSWKEIPTNLGVLAVAGSCKVEYFGAVKQIFSTTPSSKYCKECIEG